MTSLEELLRGGDDVAGAAERATERAIAQARALGLTDVSYAFEPSPVGELLVAVTPRGLIRLAYNAEEYADSVLDELARRISPRVVEAPAALDEVRRELDEYFEGKRTSFDIPIDWRLHDGFGRRVLRATARIPFGTPANFSLESVATPSASASCSALRRRGLACEKLMVSSSFHLFFTIDN